ncbi:hypothetical protein BWD09_06985 [Neisseria dentiae]|uniref:Uncharacterized protein n=1 Tax=Neisseria dentiae TaxID=194197 RepID=A0A1X3D9C9_9NEIS|nr:hypothetical protein [Neisseria dentiae]OSI16503.1 hypothetical protein BWD09_06985 [Neisseria dentiae]QMT44229.1 hypothetical protein H3L92_06950 [Neisseria dentiae]STZ49903.1 Uncharacterised protein [Neisseria dentiae]STZ83161.1 Uncharacterised protein [Neisseria dentiae]
MVKFYVDGQGLSAIAQALSGQSKQAGIQKGLQNQMMAAKLDNMRFEQQEKYRQQEAKDGLLTSTVRQMFPHLSQREQENIAYQAGGNAPVRGFQYGSDGQPVMGADGVPLYDDDYSIPDSLRNTPQFSALTDAVKKLNMANAYGKDIEDVARGHGRMDLNNYESGLRSNLAQALAQGNREAANQYTSALSGKAYEPFQMAGNGLMYNQATGAYQDTPLSISNINQNNAAAFANQQRGNLYGVQQDTERTQQQSYLAQADERLANAERLRQTTAGVISNNGVMFDANGNIQRVQGEQKPLPAPNNDVVRMFGVNTGEVDPITQKPIITTDIEYMNNVQNFAVQNGIGNWVTAKYMYDQSTNPVNVGRALGAAVGDMLRQQTTQQKLPQQQATKTAAKATPESIVGIKQGMSQQQIYDALSRAHKNGTVDKAELKRLADKYLK